MKKRQIYYYNADDKTYYVSGEFIGDKTELEQAGGTDSCDKEWDEILYELDMEKVGSLLDFLHAVSRINSYYHLADALPGSRIYVYRTRDEIQIKDETYAIYSNMEGVYLELEHSSCIEMGKNSPQGGITT